MIVTINGERSLRRYRSVIAHKSKLRLASEVLATFASHSRHRLTASVFCLAPLIGIVHRQRGTKVFFHQALQDRKLFAIPDIHYFDAHRLRAHLLQAQELQRVTSQVLKEREIQSKMLHRKKRDTTDAEIAETAAEEVFLPVSLGCVRLGSLSPGFPLPPHPAWLVLCAFWFSQCSAGPSPPGIWFYLQRSGCYTFDMAC